MNWFSLGSLLFAVAIAGFNAAMFLVIKFNDMKHLAEDMKKLVLAMEKLGVKIELQGERISTIEGTCKANHK